MSEHVDVIVLSGGTGQPSSTRLLADRVAVAVQREVERTEAAASTSVVEISPLATDVATALVGAPPSAALEAAIATVGRADVLVAATPVYKAQVSGLFKSFVDLLDDDLLIGRTVVPVATAGSGRHAMVVDEQLRPLFAYLRAVVVPTSLFAAPEDWADPALGHRIDRAAVEAAALRQARPVLDARSWDRYQHRFGSRAEPAAGAPVDPDFDSPLMRLAAGGQVKAPALADRRQRPGEGSDA